MFPKLFCLLLSISTGLYSTAQDSLVKSAIPPNILFKKQLFSNYCLSPNGKYFAETLDNNLETDLIIVDIEAHSMFKKIPLGKVRLQSLQWLTSERLLYEARGEIFAIDIDGSNGTLLVNRMPEKVYKYYRSWYRNFRYNTVLSLLPNKKDEILIETYDYDLYASVKTVNIFTGEKKEVLSGREHKINRWLSDRGGRIKIGIRFGEEGLSYLAFHGPSGEWQPILVHLDGQDYPLEIRPNSYLEQNLNFEGFDVKPDVIYLSSNVNSDRRKLIKYDLREHKALEVVLEDINCDISDPHGQEVRLIYNSKTDAVAGFRYEGLLPKFKWYSSKFKQAHDILNKKFRLMVHDVLGADDEAKRFLIHQWSDSYAGNIGIFSIADSSYAVMHQQNDELNTYELSKSRSIVINTRDKYKIPAYLNLPVSDISKGKIPLVVLPHGGPWSRDYWEMDKFAQYFTSRGYATLKVNFRGSTGLGKEHVLAGINGIQSTMINDIADAVLYVNANYPIDTSRVFLYGHSYGGYATYMGLMRYPGLFASGVAVSAPSDFKSWMKYQKKENHNFTYEFWKVALGSKSNDYLKGLSPLYKIKQLTRPIMIVHGARDGIVPVEQAKSMVIKLRSLRKDVQSKIFENEGHSFQNTHTISYLLNLSYEFFEQVNGTQQTVSGK